MFSPPTGWKYLTAVTLVAALPTFSPADEITVDGVHHKDVYVRSTARMYYIQTPDDGKVLSVLREDVAPESVVITADEGERAALLARWKSNNSGEKQAAKVRDAMADAASSEAQAASSPTTLQGRGTGVGAEMRAMRSNGYIPYIKLKDVPLGQALDALLRPLGLDYKVYGDIVYISSPELLQREAPGGMVTRSYAYNGNDTLHKIVLRNQFGVSSIPQMGGLGGGFGGQQGFGGGFGTPGAAGGQGGFGGQGAGGFGGGGGGGFGGGGGGGFGGGGGGGDVTGTSNISDLFSTIDDRLVGEAPAQIGSGYYFQD
ncbi:MAG: hypothetical protein JNK74_09430 [Candidatus Hydrogenedentes bacterium]|nr:hypothetical protein [Candidatus Hydrogenedentota bacterium]